MSVASTIRPWSTWLAMLGLLAACDDAAGPSDAGDSDAGTDDAAADASDAGEPNAANDGGEDAPDADGEAEDATPPSDPATLRSVTVRIEGALPAEFDLASDARWVLPEPAPAVFTVLARDDEDSSDELEVFVVDTLADAQPPVESRSFEAGLWRVEVNAQAGSELVVAVVDASDNETRGEHRLQLPSLAEALTGDWQRRGYDASQTVTERTNLTFHADGSFEESGPGASEARSGTYAVEAAELVVEQRTDGAGDDDPSSIERTRVGPFYVDATYFSEAPYTRADPSTEAPDAGAAEAARLEGEWQRSGSLDTGAGKVTIQETLVLNMDGSFRHERSEAGTTETRAGSFEVEPASSYTESFGNFLVFTVTEEDDVEVTPTSRTELFNLRAGRLLISPFILAE